MGFLSKLRKDEQGVAMIIVVVLSAVLMMLGAGMYVVATRENTMTRADNVGGQAFYYAEGGLENAIDILNHAATEYQLTRLRPDQSNGPGDPNPGYGYLMDPVPANRQTPTDPVKMNIGGELFTVWVDEVNSLGNHCESCGLNLDGSNPDYAYLLIMAEARSDEGYRKLEQRVMLEATHFPMTLFIDGDANVGGTVNLTNQSIFVRGDFYGREKLTVSGSDLPYGGSAGVFATGSIYAKQNGHNSQIYTILGVPNPLYWDSDYEHDRDSRGPVGNVFTTDDLEGKFNTGGLTTQQLLALKGMAKTNGLYLLNPENNSRTIKQTDLPARNGNLVVYIEFSTGDPEDNDVILQFEWPDKPDYTEGQVFVVVKNGNVQMTGQEIGYFNGSVYCPDGEVELHGNGSGEFTGFLWGKGLTDIGNFNFNMRQEFLNDPPFYAWTVTRIPDWTEVDR